jgi:hypothetical protein
MVANWHAVIATKCSVKTWTTSIGGEMTIAPAAGDTDSRPSGSGRRTYRPAAAGLAYLVAWAVGLAAWPANLALNATAGQTAAAYRAHPAAAVGQYLLVEGVAGVLLGIVLGYLIGAARAGGRGARQLAGPIALGALAVVVSVTQCVLGLFVTAAATSGEIASCGALADAVNRLDGVKMLALAAAAAWLAASANPAWPRWLRAVTVPLGLALIASGYAYLTLANALGWTAYISGPLLLLWVAGSGIAVSRRQRRAGPGRAGQGRAESGTS